MFQKKSHEPERHTANHQKGGTPTKRRKDKIIAQKHAYA
jgi:hypothetical protein